MTVAAGSNTSAVVLQSVEMNGYRVSEYSCCNGAHVVTLKMRLENRMRRQRMFHYKCGGHGLVRIPSCGWETDFVNDDDLSYVRWEAHPDRCPNCNGSIYLRDSLPVTEVHDVVAWDTGEILNPGEKAIWDYIQKNLEA